LFFKAIFCSIAEMYLRDGVATLSTYEYCGSGTSKKTDAAPFSYDSCNTTLNLYGNNKQAKIRQILDHLRAKALIEHTYIRK
jgi:hypothetical protein